MAELPLSKGYVAIIDDADLAWASQWKWYAQPHGNGVRVYARRTVHTDVGRTRAVWLHRELVAAAPGAEVDHVDGDTLNCRRSNLRIATRQQNNWNQRRPPSKSGYRGVKAPDGRRRTYRYKAMICVAGRRINLGWSDTAEDAARLYDDAALRYFGEFAVLNFPNGIRAPEYRLPQAAPRAERRPRYRLAAPGIAKIFLTRGLVAIVDEADVEALCCRSWSARPARSGKFYAATTIHSKGHQASLLMHNAIVTAPPGLVVHHINGDPLDNRRANLTIATRSQVMTAKSSRSLSGYRGVQRAGNRWRALLGAHGKSKHLGSFLTAEEAALAYDAAALAVHGEFAVLNFPTGAPTPVSDHLNRPDLPNLHRQLSSVEAQP